MTYRCPKCKIRFVKEGININQKHACGEFAIPDWDGEGDEREGK
jgi:hypothetical protein